MGKVILITLYDFDENNEDVDVKVNPLCTDFARPLFIMNLEKK